MKTTIRISDMCSYLSDSFFGDIEIDNQTDVHPSPERIQQIILAKLKRQQEQQTGTMAEPILPVLSAESPVIGRRHIMKKNTLKILLIAAAMCLVSISAVAASNNLNYFKSIFGNSAETVKGDIQSPRISKANNDYKITEESLLSDGYKTNIIFSLENLKGNDITGDPSQMFSVQAENKSGSRFTGISYSCEALEELQQGDKCFYRMEVSSLESHLFSSIKISLSNTSLNINIPVEHCTIGKTIKINGKKYENKNYCPESVQLSPLGVLVIGKEKKAKAGLPTAEISVLMKDGSTEELMSSKSFDSGDGSTVIGGGGAVLTEEGQKKPLVSETMGERNPNGKIVSTGYFSRILDLKQVKSILVDGSEYPVG